MMEPMERYKTLLRLQRTAKAFADLRDLIPEEDDCAGILDCMVDRLLTDVEVVVQEGLIGLSAEEIGRVTVEFSTSSEPEKAL